MKILNSKQKKYIIYMLSLILLCETLLKINNVYFKVIGIFMLPVIIAFCLLVLKNDIKSK